MNTNPTRTLQTTILALVVVGLLALALGGYLSPLSRYIITPLVTAQTWLATRFQAVTNVVNSPQDATQLRQRNSELEAEVSRLQTEIITLQQQLAETRILSELVEFRRQHTEFEVASASVIGRDPNPFMQYVIINVGSDKGIRKGMPVVNQKGLVGRVAAVTAGAARVQLITDTASAINVRFEISGAEAVLNGQLTGEVVIEQIPQSENVEIGDLILTSGLGGNYPPNLLIGQVSGIHSRDYDLFQSASVQPAVDFRQLEIVMVITNFNTIDIAPLVPEQ